MTSDERMLLNEKVQISQTDDKANELGGVFAKRISTMPVTLCTTRAQGTVEMERKEGGKDAEEICLSWNYITQKAFQI